MSERKSRLFQSPTMDQGSFHGFNDYASYLTSLMQGLNLSNNYQEEYALPNQYQLSNAASNYTLPNQYQLSNAASNYALPSQYQLSNAASNYGLPNQYQLSNAASSSSSSEFELPTWNIQSPATLYPSTAGRITDDFVISNRINRITLLEDICIDPYTVMLDQERCSEFLKLLQNCNRTVLNHILRKMAEFPDTLLIFTSCDSHGSRVLKKLINAARKLPSVSWFPRIFSEAVVYLMNHKQARHVVQECFVSLDTFLNEPLYEEVMKHWCELAINKYGCISLQYCMDYMDSSPVLSYDRMTYEPSLKERLLMDISYKAAPLALDIYGNYVLQHVLVMNYPKCNQVISKELRPLYEPLCIHQRGSFLVQKLCGTQFRTCVAEELLKSNMLVKIAQNQYGNYVIQNLLKEMKEHDVLLYEKLYKKLLRDFPTFEGSLFGKNVANLIKDEMRGDEASGYAVQKWQKEVVRQQGAAKFVEKKKKKEFSC
ncbi:pumilio homolog 12 [Spinacia oleracea]|uniref:Pumilio homolog 12 n=1 Tax=Spinacia oleracea TaxID=3562 RepID=A0A9R0J230_SPIOL|nr:pumilio homolog 12-like [Spinacia oleracea]